MSALTGLGGTGKSKLAVYLGICTALDLPFLGAPVKSGKVFYLDFELGERATVPVIKRVAKGLGVSPDRLEEKFFYHPFTSEGLLLPESVNDIRASLAEHKPRLVIVDAFQAAFADDPNDPKKVTLQIKTLAQLAADFDTAVMFLDHVPKDQKGFKSRSMYGSVFKTNHSRSVNHLREDDEDPSIVVWEADKTNVGPRHIQIGIRSVHDNDADTITFSKVDMGFKDKSEKDAVIRVVSGHLEDHMGTRVLRSKLIDLAVKETGVSRPYAEKVFGIWIDQEVKRGTYTEHVEPGKGPPKSYQMAHPLD